MKAAIFHPATITAIRLFPAEVRRELGKAIFDVQNGEVLGMPLSRSMPSVDAGVSSSGFATEVEFIVFFYYRQSSRGILVFHAFLKKTQAIPKRELNLARTRLKELFDEKV